MSGTDIAYRIEGDPGAAHFADVAATVQGVLHAAGTRIDSAAFGKLFGFLPAVINSAIDGASDVLGQEVSALDSFADAVADAYRAYLDEDGQAAARYRSVA